MQHQHLKDIESKVNIRGIQTKTLVDHKNATIKNLILKQGEKIPNHQVPVDVTFFVLSGKGRIIIDDSVYQVMANDIVTCPPNTMMSVIADKDSGLSFLNIKTPGLNLSK